MTKCFYNKDTLRILILSFFLLAFLTKSFSQESFFSKISTEDGLPSSVVYQVLQDDNGIMWILTEEGLCKYDGREVIVFDTERGAHANDNFLGIIDKNRLWLQSIRSLYYFDSEKETFSKKILAANNFDDRMAEPMVFDDLSRQLFIDSHFSELFVFDSILQTKKYNIGKNKLCHLEDKRILLLGHENLSIYANITSDSIASSPHSLVSISQIRGHPLKDIKGNLFLLNGTSKIFILDNFFNFFEIKHITDLIEKANTSIGTIRFIDEILYLCTTKGLIRIKNYSDVENFQADIYFSEAVISNIIRDQDGGYWISTMGDGIYYCDNISNKNYFIEEGRFQHISGYYGYKILTSTRNRIFTLKNKKARGSDLTSYETPNLNSYFLELPDSNNIWSGGRELFNNGIQKFSLGAKDIFFTKEDEILVAGSAKIFSISDSVRIILEQRAMKIIKDQNDKIWFGNEGGLFSFDDRDTIFWTERNEMLGNSITDLELDSIGRTWIAIRGKGIVCISENQITIWDQNELPNLGINGFHIDEKNLIWIILDDGLVTIKPSQDKAQMWQLEHVYMMNKSMGRTINDAYIYNDQVWLATSKGVLELDKSDLQKEYQAPKIKIDKVNNFNPSHFNYTADLSFDYREVISLAYTGVLYRNPEGLNYSYRLLPDSTKWSTTADQKIDLINLSPGDYTFELRAQEEITGKQSKVKQISFNVLRPFYLTWWFYLGILTGIVCLIWSLVRWQTARVRKRDAEKHEMELQFAELRLKAIQARMNPHFVFNAINTIPSFVGNQDPLALDRYVAKLSRLIRKFIDVSPERMVSLEEELELINLYCEVQQTRFPNKFDFDIRLSNDIDASSTYIPTMLLQIFIENAIIHGLAPLQTKGNLTVSFSIDKKNLVCVIDDTGIGRKAAKEIQDQKNKQRKSWGIHLTEDHMKLMEILEKKTIKTKIVDKEIDGDACGTRVELTFPLSTNGNK